MFAEHDCDKVNIITDYHLPVILYLMIIAAKAEKMNTDELSQLSLMMTSSIHECPTYIATIYNVNLSNLRL